MEILTHSRWVCSAKKKKNHLEITELSKISEHTAVMSCTLRNAEREDSSPWFKAEPQALNVSRTLYSFVPLSCARQLRMLDFHNCLQYSALKLGRGYNLMKCHKTQVLLSKIEVNSMRKESESGLIYNVDCQCLLGPSQERQEPLILT